VGDALGMTRTVQERLQELAAAALAQSNGDLDSARKKMKAQLLRNAALLSDLIDEVVYKATEITIGVTHRNANRVAFNNVVREAMKSDKAAQHEKIQSAVRVLLLDVVLGNGVRLRSATAPELRREAEFHWKQSKTMGAKAAFFQAVASRLPDNKTSVEKVLSEDDLRDLFNDARNVA
jgi:hypothetical protein